jgi:hypothetical protein
VTGPGTSVTRSGRMRWRESVKDAKGTCFSFAFGTLLEARRSSVDRYSRSTEVLSCLKHSWMSISYSEALRALEEG